MNTHRIAFIGAGKVAHYHACALANLPYYYPDAPGVIPIVISSVSSESRQYFRDHFGFREVNQPSEIWDRNDIDAVFILGPNNVHYRHLRRVLAMDGVQRVYLEKPICVGREEEQGISQLIADTSHLPLIQIGFQFLQMSTIRYALRLWRQNDFGKPIHFHARYLHSGYLDASYRSERQSRLKPSPEGGAIADLGSHIFSLSRSKFQVLRENSG